MQRPLLQSSFLVLLVAVYPPSGLSISNPLTPPAGNSLHATAKAFQGVHVYTCIDGDWIFTSAYAVLLDSNSGQIVGNYSFVQHPESPKSVGEWTLFNSPVDYSESGSPFSIVSGNTMVLATPKTQNDMSDFLAVASSHKNAGTASLVSYITQRGTQGGVPAYSGQCKTIGKQIQVPYQANYEFWNQDLVPPNMPPSLKVSSDHLVQGFYGTGVVTYEYDGHEWQQKGIISSMYDLPGGTQVGSYYATPKTDNSEETSCWKINDPNGFEVVAKLALDSVQVTDDCLPWSLNVVTWSSGNTTMFGPYTYVQAVSTTGGLPPKRPAEMGVIWQSPFSAIYWFYCK